MAKSIIVRSFQEAVADANKKFVQAGISTVNRVAFTGRKNAISLIQKNFTTRSNFVVNSLRVDMCPKSVKSISDVKAILGLAERAGYMALHETGGTKRNPSGGNLAIPNTRARVGGSNEKKVSRSLYYSRVKQNIVRGSSRFSSHKAAFVAQAFVAAQKKLFVRKGNSIFKVQAFRKKGDVVSFKMKQIYNEKHQSVQIKQNQWMAPAVDFASNLMQDIFNQEMEKL